MSYISQRAGFIGGKRIGCAWRYFHQFRQNRVPGQLVIQMTDRCNARCPQCGMNTSQHYERHQLGLAEMKKIIDHAGQRQIEALSFTGGSRCCYSMIYWS